MKPFSWMKVGILGVAVLSGCRTTGGHPARGTPERSFVREEVPPAAPGAPSDYVPLRSVADETGLRIFADGETGTYYLEGADGQPVAAIVAGSARAVVGGRTVEASRPVTLVRGSPALPAELAAAIRTAAGYVPPPPPAYPPVPGPLPPAPSIVPGPTFSPDPGRTVIPVGWDVAARRTWRHIVIHHSGTEEGGAHRFDVEHRNGRHWQNGLGYHFVIGNGTDTGDGAIEIGSRWLRQNEGIDGAHAGCVEYNRYGIGICLVGDFTTHGPSPRQVQALVDLIVRLQARYGIPTEQIVTHQAVRPHGTECPGDRFPWDEILARVRARWTMAHSGGR